MRQGYEVYLPLAKKKKPRRHTKIDRTPLFPRYLFIRLDKETDLWQPIRSTRGVHSLVRFGAEAGRVPNELVSALKAKESDDGLHTIPEPMLMPGTKVNITDGPMAGYEALYMQQDARLRVTLLLEIMGHHTRVQVASDSIEPASD